MTVAQFIIENTQKLVTISDTGNEYNMKTSSIDEHVKNISFVNPEKLLHLNHETTVIDSINSGTGRIENKDVYQRIIRPLFQLLEIKHRYFCTQNKDSIREFALSLGIKKERTIIFLSGDTSISEFVNGLPEIEQVASINIIIIPCGTGNSLSLSLGIDNTINAVENILLGSKVPFNLYQLTLPRDSYFLFDGLKIAINGPLVFTTVLSWAFHASIVADSDTRELRKFGIDRFKMAAIKNLEKEQKYDGSIIIGDKLVDGPFAYWLVTSVTRFEPTFKILPHGDIANDSLYMVAVNAKYGTQLLDIMNEVYDNGRHIEDEKVTYMKVMKNQKIRVKLGADAKNRFCLDGSIVILPQLECEIGIESVGNFQKNWRTFVFR